MDLTTNSEHFYNSILKLLNNLEERDEVDQLMVWWNRYALPPFSAAMSTDDSNSQVFLLYASVECLPSKNSALSRICQKHAEIKNREQVEVV